MTNIIIESDSGKRERLVQKYEAGNQFLSKEPDEILEQVKSIGTVKLLKELVASLVIQQVKMQKEIDELRSTPNKP